MDKSKKFLKYCLLLIAIVSTLSLNAQAELGDSAIATIEMTSIAVDSMPAKVDSLELPTPSGKVRRTKPDTEEVKTDPPKEENGHTVLIFEDEKDKRQKRTVPNTIRDSTIRAYEEKGWELLKSRNKNDNVLDDIRKAWDIAKEVWEVVKDFFTKDKNSDTKKEEKTKSDDSKIKKKVELLRKAKEVVKVSPKKKK